jgi:hypothetical protein
MILLLLAIFFVILNILDVTTTRTVLRNGGREVNPIARMLMRFHLFIPAKTGMVIIVLLIMSLSDTDTGTTLGVICCVMYVLVVWNNFRAIKRKQPQCEK